MNRFFFLAVTAIACSFAADSSDACDQCNRAAAATATANANTGRRDPALDRQMMADLQRMNAESDAALARNAAERQQAQQPAQPAQPSLLMPGNTYVRVKLGGYRLTSNYSGGDGGSIAAEADEAEVISPDVNPGLNLAREFRDKRDQRMHQDVEKLFEKPFTKVVTETRIIQQPCPQPAPYCAGLRRPYCAGLRSYSAPVHSCSCNGVGCTHCRGASYVPVTTSSYGRCAAWSYVRGTPLSCYRDPPGGRDFWCNCASHQAAVTRTYGYGSVWQLVPCMCASGCTQCGGAGRCGTH